MAAQITAYGLLVEEPQTKTARNGAKMAVSRLAVYLPCDSSRNPLIIPIIMAPFITGGGVGKNSETLQGK